jgi:hypothetical protein
MIVILQIALVAVNIGMAWLHDKKIAKHKAIKHFVGGTVYLILAAGMPLLLFNGGGITREEIIKASVFFVCALLQRKSIFDSALNLFRNLPLFYVSNEPRGKSFWEAMDHDVSVIDWLHYKAFGNRSELYVIIYLLLWVLGLAYMMAT